MQICRQNPAHRLIGKGARSTNTERRIFPSKLYRFFLRPSSLSARKTRTFAPQASRVESLEPRTFLSVSASAQIALVSTSGTGTPVYHYDITVTNTGTTNIGTFWFAWLPSGDFLPTAPSSVSNPAGWGDTLTGAGTSADGTAIEWVAASNPITPGNVLSGFDFSTTDSPAVLAGNAPSAPSEPVLTSVVYSAGPFSDAGFNFQVAEAATATPSTTTLVSSTSTSTAASPVTFTATVAGSGATPTGTVSFTQNGNPLGTVNVAANGTAALTTSALSVGTDHITAFYNGDSNHSSSTSAEQTVTVSPPATVFATTTSLASSAPSAASGASVVLTATITPSVSGPAPTGSVSFAQDGNALGTAPMQANGTASLTLSTLPVGSDSIVATYSGDSVYAASTSTPLVQTITQSLTLVPAIASSKVPSSVVSGTAVKGSVKITLTNQTSSPIKGRSTLALYATTNGVIDSSAVLLGQVASNVNVKNGKALSKSIALHVAAGALPPGSYQLVARVTDPSGTINDSAPGPALTAAAPFISLSQVVGKSTLPASATSGGKGGVVLLTLTNGGNIATSGATTIALFATTSGTVDSSATQLASLSKTLRIQPGKSAHVSVPVKQLPTLAPGSYTIVAQVTDQNGHLSSTLVGTMTIA